jgi:hypothetical protein
LTDGLALLGTWKMVSWTREVVATGAITDVMGTDPISYIAYHADGRMMASSIATGTNLVVPRQPLKKRSVSSIRCLPTSLLTLWRMARSCTM